MSRAATGPLDEAELAELADFLASDAVADTTMDIAMLDGFLTAIASGPARPALERWLPWVFDYEQGRPRFELPPRQARTITERIARHLEGIALAIEEDPDEFEPLFYEREFDGVTLEVPDEWCTGFLVGVSLEADAWQPLVDAHPELFRALRLHGTEAGWAELDAMEDLAERHEDFLDEIADAVREIQAHWREHRVPASASATVTGQPPPASRALPKVGRNEPCPCGSGRKFKLCHGAAQP